MEVWNNIDDTGDDRMDVKEFDRFLRIGELNNYLTQRLFDVFNTQMNGYINFFDFLTSMFRYCPYDRERCIELSFRLISRRGNKFDPKCTCLDLIDFEKFVKERYVWCSELERKRRKKRMGDALFC